MLMMYYIVMNTHFKALAEPNRIHIVQLLQNGSLPVGEIATKLHLNQPQVSKHLRVLADAGLVEVQHVAKQHIYTIRPQSFKQLEQWISSYHHFSDDKFDRLDTYLSTIQGKEEKKLSEKTALQTSFQTDQELVITRMFDAPRALVYKAYTDPKLAADWWGLKSGTTTTIDKMDVRPGGLWRFVQHDASGKEYACNGIYREVMQNFLLVYTFTMENTPGHTVKMVKFEEQAGKTKLTDTTFFYTSKDRQTMMRSGMGQEVHDNMNELSTFLDSRTKKNTKTNKK